MSAVAVGYQTTIENLLPEIPLVRTNVSWDEYVRVSDEIGERPGVRVTYDQGRMEIMTLSPEHEGPSRLFTHLISVLVEETGLDYISLGSMTLRLKAISAGLEADDCYYIGDFSAVAGIKRMDLTVSPPPDLAIEVDISHGSRGKFRIYAGLGVKQLWLFDGKALEFYRLSENSYVAIQTSDLFPFLPPDVV
ncbi:MAG: Uma2 family endonuclease, partial [Acidobacteriota bacterium]